MKRTFLALAFVLAAFTANAQDCCNQQTACSNDVINTIMSRLSIRKYLDKPVEHEKLTLLAKCGINAPNGMNSQRWAVRDKYGHVTGTSTT